MLSILIPTYNYNITTLIAQLYSQATKLEISFEIIVREDASKLFIAENSQIKKLQNVFYQKSTQNLGRSATRDLLAKAAKYDKLLFLDADVLAFDTNFIARYIENFDTQVVCGGITYNGVLPKENELLRFNYGIKKEQQTAIQRSNRNYIITAGNFRIDSTLFLEINTKLDNFYGDDLLLSQQLKNKKSTVLHINNPVKHLGLETSEEFLEKSLLGVQSIFKMERDGLLDIDFTKLQSVYLKIKKIGLLTPTFRFLATRKDKLKKNLLGQNPKPLYFDLYRLHYYMGLKMKANA